MQEVFEKIIDKLRTEKNMDRSKAYSAEQCDAISYAFGAAIDDVKVAVAEYNNGWIPCSERLPNKDEYLKDDGKFIVTNGGRRYQSIFDIYSGKFKTMKEVSPVGWYSMVDDKCIIAWQPLPECWKGE